LCCKMRQSWCKWLIQNNKVMGQVKEGFCPFSSSCPKNRHLPLFLPPP
jgi:hypothetical protein